MRRVIVLVATGDYYGDPWWVENMEHMLLESGTDYDYLQVVRDEVYGGVFDKLTIFERFQDSSTEYLYLDLDMTIHDSLDHLYRKDLTVLHAWWREKLHTPLNSSVISWTGNYSWIHTVFAQDPEYFMLKYQKGIDQYLYEIQKPKKYGPVCNSMRYGGWNDLWPICLFNQRSDTMRSEGPWQKYLL